MSSIGPRSTLAVIELVAAVLLLVVGLLMGVMAILGFIGGGLLAAFGALEIILSLVSFAAISGLRSLRRSAWSLARWLAIATIVINVAGTALGVIGTATVSYPGVPVVLLILINDVVIAEVALLYFLTRPDTKAEFRDVRA